MAGRQNEDIADTVDLRDVAMATTFWLSMGHNFDCMIVSDTLFDCRGGFSGSSYRMKTSRFLSSKGRCHSNRFLAFYNGCTLTPHGEYD